MCFFYLMKRIKRTTCYLAWIRGWVEWQAFYKFFIMGGGEKRVLQILIATGKFVLKLNQGLTQNIKILAA